MDPYWYVVDEAGYRQLQNEQSMLDANLSTQSSGCDEG